MRTLPRSGSPEDSVTRDEILRALRQTRSIVLETIEGIPEIEPIKRRKQPPIETG